MREDDRFDLELDLDHILRSELNLVLPMCEDDEVEVDCGVTTRLGLLSRGRTMRRKTMVIVVDVDDENDEDDDKGDDDSTRCL